MDKKICIAIDAMGGENAPFKNIEGINLFYQKNKGVNDYLFNILPGLFFTKGLYRCLCSLNKSSKTKPYPPHR